jgi:hypothetical protein
VGWKRWKPIIGGENESIVWFQETILQAKTVDAEDDDCQYRGPPKPVHYSLQLLKVAVTRAVADLDG